MSSRYVSDSTHWYRGKMPTDVPGHKPCDHEWDRWEDFADGNGGTMVCGKCGMSAINWTLSLDDAFERPKK